MTVDLGDPVTRTLEVRVSGVLVAPSTVVLTVRSPAGVDTTPAVTNEGVGLYSATWTPDATGTWRYRWVTTGTGAGSESGSVTVVDPWSLVLTLDDLKAHLNETSTTHDDELREFLQAAVTEVEREVGPLASTTVVETFPGGGSTIVPRYANLLGITAAAYGDGTAIDTDDLVAENGLITWAYGTAGTWVAGTRNVTITYTAGFTTLPADLRLAVLDIAAAKWRASQRSGGTARPQFPGGGDEPFDAPPSTADAWRVVRRYSGHVGIA